MTAAFITACASVVVALLVFILNQRAQIRQEQRQAKLTRINSQLRELYGPLNALVEVNERIWEAMRSAGLPSKAERQAAVRWEHWQQWVDHALMPTNLKMRDLVMDRADLFLDGEFPVPLQEFCAHVASYEVLLAGPEEQPGPALVPHPGESYTEYVRTSFARLRDEQRQLLADARRGR